MLTAAGEHGYLLCLLDGLLILRLIIVGRYAHLERYLSCLAVKELILISICSVRSAYDDIKARILERLYHRVEIVHRTSVKAHVIPRYLGKLLRGKGRGQEVIAVNELIAPVIQKFLLVDFRPDIRSRLRRIQRGRVKKGHAVAFYIRSVHAAEDNVGQVLGAGVDYGIKHKAQYRHAYKPCDLLPFHCPAPAFQSKIN